MTRVDEVGNMASKVQKMVKMGSTAVLVLVLLALLITSGWLLRTLRNGYMYIFGVTFNFTFL